MTGDCHVRFCESRGVRLPPATHLTAGPVPPRVDTPVKAGLLDLLDDAAARGWSRRRACRLLDLDEDRTADWVTRLRRLHSTIFSNDYLHIAPPTFVAHQVLTIPPRNHRIRTTQV